MFIPGKKGGEAYKFMQTINNSTMRKVYLDEHITK